MLVGIIFGTIILIGFVALQSFSPVNSEKLVFEPSTNIYLKAVNSPEGYHYLLQSTRGSRSASNVLGSSPPLIVPQGNLVQIHLINEEKNLPENPSAHNLHINEFNVHSKDLGYFQTESILFLADKPGTFDYYCSIHPEMKGTITITENS